MSKTYCSLAWRHLFLFPDGTAKLCCWAEGSVTQDGKSLSLDKYKLDDVWNSPYMREVRRKMVDGEPVQECSLCYREEERLGWSYRIASNDQWLRRFGLTAEEEMERARADSYRVEGPPIFFQLNLGNLCNLKCRMCNSTFSSQIERDPAHNKWAPAQPSGEDGGIFYWTEDGGFSRRSLGDPAVGQTGFHGLEKHQDRQLQWTNGSATVSASLKPGTRVTGLEIKLWGYHPARHRFKVSINKRTVYEEVLQPKSTSLLITLDDRPISGDVLDITLESDTFRAPGDPRALGVAVESLTLFKSPTFAVLPSAPAAVQGRRFSDAEAWYDSEEFIFGEMLRNVKDIRELYFTGGEPLLNPRVEKIIDHLIEQGCTNQVKLQFNTNCTKIPEGFVEKLAQFPDLKLSLSLDGEGATYEYIRHPGRWKNVSQNIEKLVQLKHADITAVPILQIYNALNIVDLCRFCDTHGIKFALMPLWGPSHLHVGVMPKAARELAASRLKAYAATECRPENLGNVQTAIEFIETQPDMSTPEMLHTFMTFTNDLDAGRNQDFRTAHPELLDLIVRTGFPWSDQTLHAPVPKNAVTHA